MAVIHVWIIECKLTKRGRHWMPSLDCSPKLSQTETEQLARQREQENPGFQYRAIPFTRNRGY